MKRLTNTEELIDKINVVPGAKMDQRTLGDALTAHDESRKQQRPEIQPNIWRITMKSRITKLAAAAVVAVGIMWSITLFDGSLSPAFAIDDVGAAIAKAECVHMTWQYTEQNIEPNDVRKQTVESWVSVKPRRHIRIYQDGSIHFIEYDETNGEIKAQSYDPQTNIITNISRGFDKSDDPSLSLVDSFREDISRLESRAARVEYTDTTYGGHPAKRIDVVDTTGSSSPREFSIIVDTETSLPKQTVFYMNGSMTTVTFDYPAGGPSDIYQVGVAKDTKVNVIDYRPSYAFLEAIKPYREARESLPRQRMVVDITNENDARYRVCVIYTDGRKERFEHLMWVKNNAPPTTDDFNDILGWALTVDSDELGIQLYDGEYVHHVERDYRNRWTGYRRYSPSHKPDYVVGGLVHRGWPKIQNGKPVANTYAIENNLLCIEEPDEKTLYYIDPAHDYMCVRTESFHDLPISPDNSTHSEPYRVSTVTELGRTDSGQWYPREITTNRLGWWHDYPGNAKTLEERFIIRLYMEASSHLSDDVFDAQSLPDVSE